MRHAAIMNFIQGKVSAVQNKLIVSHLKRDQESVMRFLWSYNLLDRIKHGV